MMEITLIAVATGVALGVFSFAKEKAFLILIFVGLPLLAYFAHYLGELDMHLSWTSNKSAWQNIMTAFNQVPENWRGAVLAFFPSLIAGRILTTIYNTRQEAAFMDPGVLRKKKPKILKSYGMD